jgi:hypothetical protein
MAREGIKAKHQGKMARQRRKASRQGKDARQDGKGKMARHAIKARHRQGKDARDARTQGIGMPSSSACRQGIIGIGMPSASAGQGIGMPSASARHRHRQDATAGRQDAAKWRSIVIQILKEC